MIASNHKLLSSTVWTQVFDIDLWSQQLKPLGVFDDDRIATFELLNGEACLFELLGSEPCLFELPGSELCLFELPVRTL